MKRNIQKNKLISFSIFLILVVIIVVCCYLSCIIVLILIHTMMMNLLIYLHWYLHFKCCSEWLFGFYLDIHNIISEDCLVEVYMIHWLEFNQKQYLHIPWRYFIFFLSYPFRNVFLFIHYSCIKHLEFDFRNLSFVSFFGFVEDVIRCVNYSLSIVSWYLFLFLFIIIISFQ